MPTIHVIWRHLEPPNTLRNTLNTPFSNQTWLAELLENLCCVGQGFPQKNSETSIYVRDCPCWQHCGHPSPSPVLRSQSVEAWKSLMIPRRLACENAKLGGTKYQKIISWNIAHLSYWLHVHISFWPSSKKLCGWSWDGKERHHLPPPKISKKQYSIPICLGTSWFWWNSTPFVSDASTIHRPRLLRPSISPLSPHHFNNPNP